MYLAESALTTLCRRYSARLCLHRRHRVWSSHDHCSAVHDPDPRGRSGCSHVGGRCSLLRRFHCRIFRESNLASLLDPRSPGRARDRIAVRQSKSLEEQGRHLLDLTFRMSSLANRYATLPDSSPPSPSCHNGSLNAEALRLVLHLAALGLEGLPFRSPRTR